MTNTLTSPSLAALLDRLFTQADASWSQADPALANMSDAEQARLMRSKTDYREFYGRMKDLPLAISPEVWHEMHEVNVVAPFRLVAEAQAALSASAAARGRPGCVVNVSSHAGVRPKGASIPYAAAKAALNHVTRLLAVTLAPDIRVNAVAPGLVDTPLTQDWTQAQQLWRERAPMRRAASPDDIAQAVAWLAQSDYLTGEILLSDGGLNLT